MGEKMTPFEVQDFLFSKLGLCGCAEWETALSELRRILEWAGQDTETRTKWETLFASEGLYYLMMSMLDEIKLIEHGISIRHCWLTQIGDELLNALQMHKADEIENAEDPELSE